MSEHTPGPWWVEPWTYQGRGKVLTIRTDTYAIAQACNLWRNEESDDTELGANARLIAAAPDLLAEAELAADVLDIAAQEHPTFRVARDRLRAVIAKVKGEV